MSDTKQIADAPIDWKRVNEHLRCPQCGDKAHIDPGSDGTQASHTHYFPVSRTMAHKLSLPTALEAQIRIDELESELGKLQELLRTGALDGGE